MKSNQSFLTCILALGLGMIIGKVNANEKKVPHFTPGHFTTAILLTPHFNNFFQDTVPAKKENSKAVKAIKAALPKVEVPKVAVPKVAAPKVNSNLFKKIADVFKFRKNSREKEKKRVLGIFESLGVNDSIAASAENIKIILDELSDRENQHFDSLLAIINAIKLKEAEQPTAPSEVKPAEEKIVPEPSESKVVTDKDIEDLTNKLLPLIAEKANETSMSKEKRQTLSLLRKIRNGKSEVQYITDTVKNIVKRYTLRVINKAEVYGIHNFTRNNNYGDYKFSFINTLLYNSLFINGKTGNLKGLNEWDKASVITDAQNAGCTVAFTARIQQPESAETFLSSTKSQKNFIDNTIFLLRLRNAKAVNIQMDAFSPQYKDAFTQFIRFLSEVLKIQDTAYHILVTVPAFGNTRGYDLKALNKYTDRFLVNFSEIDKNQFGPMAPLAGNQKSIETVLSTFLNDDIPAEKLIVSASYVGTKWSTSPDNPNLHSFIQPLTYAEIRGRYDWPVYYDDASASAVMDSLNKNQAAIRTIFFDDAVSLEKKYDYILQNGLGGVTIDALGYDRGYGDLWDVLAYKFAIVDTTFLKDSIITKNLATNLTLLEKAGRYLSLFSYILNNPCEVCFENIPDTAYSIKVNRYLQELKIDSLIVQENKSLPPSEKFRSKFGYINSLLTKWLGYLTLFILLLTLIGCGIYLYKIKTESEEWAWKKKAEIILIGLCVLLVISTFTYLFTNDSIPIFGATPNTAASTTAISNDLKQAMAKQNLADSSFVIADDINTGTSYCNVDTSDTCINMPFSTLMIIIAVGMVVGVLITRYLIMPLLRRNDIP